ncbi:GTPase [uncultured Fibrobacter sp.]|uniref:GTPase n=1 Tax=uncultured Fibrobacter sp. TaxID=261512 RepID=UPI0025DE7907|nr:GTPase [uncultured Fibrobacter sp.]
MKNENGEFEYSQEKLDEELRKFQETFKKPNILICGQTGAGKSSIVNFIFKDDVAKVSNAKPCTTDITLYKGEDVNIFDSEGYEMGKEEHYKEMLFDNFLCKNEHKGIDGDESVHVVWYVINGAGKKMTDYDALLLKRILAEKYKVCIIISQIDQMTMTQLNELVNGAKAITNSIVNVSIFRTSTDHAAIEYRDGNGNKLTDWDELVEWSIAQMPDMCKDRFASALKAGLKEKRDRAFKRIAAAAVAAGGVGATPIPFSQAALLIPIQASLIISVLNIYGIKASGGTGTLGNLLVTLGVQNLGRTAAANLIKMFPGAGSVIGGIINASIAASFTTAIGKAVDIFAYTQCEKVIDGQTPIIDISAMLNSDFMDIVMQIFKQEKNK